VLDCIQLNDTTTEQQTMSRAKKPALTPTLDKLIADKLVWVENGAYVGRASDGTIVQVGCVGYEESAERYLINNPSPEQW
jgi:hypothetical protein